jgi:hypothetical protein
MTNDKYDKFSETYLKLEKLRAELRELNRQKEFIRTDSRHTRTPRNQEIETIAHNEKIKESELRKTENLFRTEEIVLKEYMLGVNDASWSIDHSFAGKTFMISLTKTMYGKSSLNINKRH